MDVLPKPFAPIKPAQSRYIKLGKRGMWEKECIENGIARIGFKAADPDVFKHCCSGDWEWIKDYGIKRGKAAGPAKSASNQLQHFFEDEGQTLWITFYNRRLFWAFLNGSKAEMDQQGAFRRVKDGWRDHDISNNELSLDKLPDFLTQLRFFKGATANVARWRELLSRINGQRPIEAG